MVILFGKNRFIKEKINGPIKWPLNSINKKDSYRLSLRPEGSGMGSKLEIDFVFDKKIHF